MVPAYLRAGDVAWFDLDAGGTKERTRPCNPKKELSMRTRTSCLTMSRSSLFSASLLGISLLIGCGNAELSDEWTPVDPKDIDCLLYTSRVKGVLGDDAAVKSTLDESLPRQLGGSQ